MNLISAGPFASRAASAIGFIHKMIAYYQMNAPLADRASSRKKSDTPLRSSAARSRAASPAPCSTSTRATTRWRRPADVEGLVDKLKRRLSRDDFVSAQSAGCLSGSGATTKIALP